MQWAKVGGYLNISQKVQTKKTCVVEAPDSMLYQLLFSFLWYSLM